MKKVKSVILIFILFLFPFAIVYASGESININCPSSAKIGDTIECVVIGNSGSSSISSVKSKFSVSDNLEIVKFTTSSIWLGDASNGSIDLYTGDNKNGNFDIGVFQIKVKDYNSSSGSVLLYDVVYSDASFKKFSVANASSTIKILSTNNYLSGLSLSSGTLSPSFNKNTFSYSATVDSNSVVISATSEDQKATISGTGSKNLSYGSNTFIVKVTSESSAVREYKIVITRPDNRKNEEDKTKTETAKDTSTSSTSASTVTLSSDNKLKSLEIEGYNIDFKADTLNYSINVNSSVSSLKVKALANSSKARVTVSGEDKIVSGENKIIISVIAENGDEKEYIIAVNKEVVSQVLLKSLEIEGYDIDFKEDKFEYELKIEDEDILNIKAIPSIEDAKVTILNNGDLKNNSIIEIKVSYEDNESIYKLNIKKDKMDEEQEEYSDNDKAKLTILTILGVLLIVVSISGLTFKIVRSIKARKHGND